VGKLYAAGGSQRPDSGPRLGQHAVLDGLVQPLLRFGQHGLLQAVDRPVELLRDVGQRRVRRELLEELAHREVQVVGSRRQVAAEGTVVIEVEARAAERERRIALADPLLQLLGLLLRDPACLQVGVDLVDRRGPRRVLELLGRDAKVLGDAGEEAVAAVRRPLRCRDRAAGSDHEREGRDRGECAPGGDVSHRQSFR
jgi:hypothetical protein